VIVRLHAHAVQCLWFWHTSTSDRQDRFAGQFTGQRFSFMGMRIERRPCIARLNRATTRKPANITSTMQQYLRRT